MKIKIDKVVKIRENEYSINDAIIIKNIGLLDNKIVYDFDYNTDKLNEKEATLTCELFISKTFDLPKPKKSFFSRFFKNKSK